MNIGLQVIRYLAGFAMIAEGFHTMLMPALLGIPLMLGGLAILAANQPVVDRFVLGLEKWRQTRLQPSRDTRR